MNDRQAGKGEGMTSQMDTGLKERSISVFTAPPPGHPDWYCHEAVRSLPRILLMVDRNPLSRTYGCFDREYWHYRTVDFPCGMSQEFCLPLALLHQHPFPGNPYYREPRLAELAEAAIDFARKSSHRDGSCDDYFPFERALGALVFSTYAMTESHQVLGLDRPDLLEFFALRGDWLRRNNETGRLANHQALAALALYNIFLLTGERRFRSASDELRDLTLSWQHEEGWFQEYEGADPGYQTCTISFLGKLYRKSEAESLVEPLERAVRFAAHFQHPDGCYGGEYGSRNTYHFYPHGFEVMSPRMPEARWVVRAYLEKSLPSRRRYFNDDNRMCAHYVYDWLQAWIDHHTGDDTEEPDWAPPHTPTWFPGAGLLSLRTAAYHAVLATSKGGVLKVHDADGPRLSDTGILLRTSNGRVAVSHLVGSSSTHDDDLMRWSIEGTFHWRRQRLSSPLRQILFRMLNLTVGRWAPNLLRWTLQRLLITGKPEAPFHFRREVVLQEQSVEIRDRIDRLASTRMEVDRLMVGSDATSIYVANSNVFQDSVLLPWGRHPEAVKTLSTEGTVELPVRRLELVSPRPGTA